MQYTSIYPHIHKRNRQEIEKKKSFPDTLSDSKSRPACCLLRRFGTRPRRGRRCAEARLDARRIDFVSAEKTEECFVEPRATETESMPNF